MPNRYDIMKAGFYDELEKISGELQGFTRSGRKPISIEKMLENESEQPSPSEVFEPVKVSSVGSLANVDKKTVGALAAGALGYGILRRANEDRKLGRQVRLQQGY